MALAVAAVATWRTPAEYRAEVVLAVEDPVSKPQGYTLPVAGWIVERAKDPAVLQRTAAAASGSPQVLAEVLTAVKEGPFVGLTVRSTHSGAELAAVLDGVVAALREDLAADMARAADGRLAELALDEMGRLGPAYVARAAWNSVTDQLVALDKEEDALCRMRAEPPSPLSVVRGVVTSGPLRPSLGMNLAVAGVLGAFVGPLLSFLIHALRVPSPGREGGEPMCGGEG